MSLPLEWSAKMQGIIRERVNGVVWNHPRSDREKNLPMGFSMEVISRRILARGLADFSAGYRHSSGHLSPEELVSLYCYTNMKKHFFTCRATFSEHREVIEDLFKPRGRILVIDFGCGPATAALALADLLPNRRMDYIGIDAAQAMRERARTLWEASQASRLIEASSTAEFWRSWDHIRIDSIRPGLSVMLVFSYFFASKSLRTEDVNGLAAWVDKLAGTHTGKPLALFYMNSTDARANEKYNRLKQRLGAPRQALQPKQTEYCTHRGGAYTTKRSEFVSELLSLSRFRECATAPEDDLIPF
jgi:hypothetical protein